jgi:hypothetical protein
MTIAQAYCILGLRPGAGPAQLDQAHAAAQRMLRLQLVPGTPRAVRQKAQAQMAELRTAFELVTKMTASPARSSCPTRSPRPKAQPATRHVGPPGASAPPPLSPVLGVSGPVLVAGMVLAGIVVFSVVLFSVRSAVTSTQNRTARLRVLSVPWSYVTLDGKPLGPSGQAEAFVLKPGKHKLVLCQGPRTLTKTISLPKDGETIVKAQLEKGQIDVIHK